MVDAARDAGIAFDMEGFDRAMQEQKTRARASWKGGSKASASPAFRGIDRTHFEGYASLASEDCEVLAIVKDGVGVQALAAGESGEVVLDHTPFYADSGGQVGDHGWFYRDNRNTLVAEVHGCVMPVQGVRAHRVTAKQPIAVGEKIEAVVDRDFRRGDAAQPHRHAPGACGVARGAGHACEAGGSRWSIPGICASTSRISLPSAMKRCRTSRTSPTARC